MNQKHISVISLAVLSAAAAYSQYIPLNTSPSRSIGHAQLALTTTSPNLVEGRELYLPQGIALDTSVSPPIVYVADTGNNRVLAWKNATSFQNGASADLVIGQKDMLTTLIQGPGLSTSSLGFYSPTAVAVRNGALYVADAGNNRILRYPQPFNQTELLPDLVIGQGGFTTRVANYPNSSTTLPSAQGLYLASGGHPALAFDTQSVSNLWVVDPGNRRVLRFSGADLDNTSLTNGLKANLEIGQLDFETQDTAAEVTTTAQKTARTRYNDPSAINFDKLGNLFVCDRGLSRVMVYTSPFTSGMSATRIMGVVVASTDSTVTIPAATYYRTQFSSPSAVIALPDNNLAVLDAGKHRIVTYAPVSQWDDEATTFSPMSNATNGLFGHSTYSATTSNDGQAAPSASTMSAPYAAVMLDNEMFLADAGNNRVNVLQYQSGAFQAGTRVLGQDRMDTGAPNLVEGREFRFSGPVSSTATANDAAILVDSTSDTPHLYVADPFNNRVLGFKDLRTLRPGDKADIVIGQPDFQTAMCNYPDGKTTSPNQTSLCHPVGLAVDSDGNLFVADTWNGRVLRFPTPFSHTATLPQADLVLGQSSFTSQFTDASKTNMSQPYGLAFAGDNGLVVSDQAHNRMLFFPKVNGGFTNGQAATKVFGQTDFTSTAYGTADDKMYQPQLVSCDTDGRPYVADLGNSRVLIFDQIMSTSNTGAHAAYSITGLSAPQGVYVSARTGEIWVTSGSSSLRYLRFDQLAGTPSAALTISAQVPVLALAQDQWGDLFAADYSNRVAVYFPPVTALNHGNSIVGRALAPGLMTDIYPASGQTFGSQTALAADLTSMVPLPTDLADIQVLFNTVAIPLYYVTPSQLCGVLPFSAPTSGTAEMQVVKKSTGQILAAGPVSMNVASPAIITTSYGTTRQAAVINQDGTVNTSTNRAARGSVISIYATGQGAVDNPPADGDVPQSGTTVSTPLFPRVWIGACWLGESPCDESLSTLDLFSGLSPSFPGIWQINVKLPSAVPAGENPIFIQYRSILSVDTSAFTTVIYVKE